MSRFRFVYFDAAGTLIAPHPSVGQVYLEAGAPHGLAVSGEQLDRAFGPAWMRWTQVGAGGPMSAIADEAATKRWWRGLVFEVLDEVGFAGEREAVFEACFSAFASARAWRIFEDSRPVLEAFQRAGMRMGILSNWDHRLPPLLETLRLAPYFERMIVSAIEGVEKPHPEIFQRAIRAAGVAPSEILYVGDHRHLDVDPARALGIEAYLVDRKGRGGPHAIPSLEDLLEIAGIQAQRP
ncbi:MAG: HAD-IA family hydrolase [Myxococcota bacterium]